MPERGQLSRQSEPPHPFEGLRDELAAVIGRHGFWEADPIVVANVVALHSQLDAWERGRKP